MDTHTKSGVDPNGYLLPESYRGTQNVALIVGAVGAAACIGGFFLDSAQFFKSYLVGWIFWLIVALGCLGWLMVNHLTGGSWGIVLRRSWEAAARTLPFFALLSIPFYFGMASVFSWAEADALDNPLIRAKAAYLNVGAFWLRAILYFGILSAWAWLLSRKSAQQDATGDAKVTRLLRNLSGPGLVLYVVCISFLCWDWLMSLEPEWFSSLYGIYFVCMTALSALAFSCILAWSFNKQKPMSELFRVKYFHDMGKLTLALTMFWAYMALSQFLITWSGNIPEFVQWYWVRNNGGWVYWSVLLVIFHFFIPFLVLLSATLKRRPGQLALVAAWMLLMQWADLYWQAVPTWADELTIHWLDFAALAAVGGLWLFLFFHELRKRTLLPVNDPFIPRVIPHES